MRSSVVECPTPDLGVAGLNLPLSMVLYSWARHFILTICPNITEKLLNVVNFSKQNTVMYCDNNFEADFVERQPKYPGLWHNCKNFYPYIG